MMHSRAIQLLSTKFVIVYRSVVQSGWHTAILSQMAKWMPTKHNQPTTRDLGGPWSDEEEEENMRGFVQTAWVTHT